MSINPIEQELTSRKETNDSLTNLIDTLGPIGIKLGQYERSPLETMIRNWTRQLVEHGSTINMAELTGGFLNKDGATYMFGDQFVDANGERFNIQIGIAKDMFAERLKQALGE